MFWLTAFSNVVLHIKRGLKQYSGRNVCPDLTFLFINNILCKDLHFKEIWLFSPVVPFHLYSRVFMVGRWQTEAILKTLPYLKMAPSELCLPMIHGYILPAVFCLIPTIISLIWHYWVSPLDCRVIWWENLLTMGIR